MKKIAECELKMESFLPLLEMQFARLTELKGVIEIKSESLARSIRRTLEFVDQSLIKCL